MATHQIDFRPSALRSLRKLPNEIRAKVGSIIQELSDNPFPRGCKKLINENDVYRVRVGDYRVLYQVESGKLLILVLKVGHRREI